ncbi:TlpA disulfide reductase family protein [soil metagenome]
MRFPSRPGTSGRVRLLTFTASLLFAFPALALDKGSDAPAFELTGVSGPVKLSSYRGKVVYVDFWASWCVPCRRSFPWMNEMQDKYGPKGLQIIGINVDTKQEDAKTFLAATPARFLVAFDPSGTRTPASYGVKGMPTSYLIDANGKLLFQHTGFNDDDKTQLESKMKMALGVEK